MSYQNVKNQLYHGHRKIANNTRLVLARDVPQHTECVVMTLHSNVVARFYPKYIQLYSCGWHTPTTKDRLNLALDIALVTHRKIYQNNWQWYYSNYHGKDHTFEDGMKIDYQGSVIS